MKIPDRSYTETVGDLRVNNKEKKDDNTNKENIEDNLAGSLYRP